MGGKKKTKWRKVPLEELSHITVKRSSNERPPVENLSQTGGCAAPTLDHQIKTGQQSDGPGIKGSSYPKSTEMEVLYADAYPQDADGVKCGPQSGFYINGLWLPMSGTESNTANNTFPTNIITTVPLIMNLPSAYSPSAYPSYAAFHSLDMTYNPIAYMQPSNVHFHCDARSERIESTDYEVNESFKIVDAFNATTCSESPGRSCLLPLNDVLLRTAKMADPTSDGELLWPSFLSREDYEAVTDIPYDACEVLLPIYPHPSCPFGQALHNVPLHQAPPPTHPTQVIYSWPTSHLQKRRKKRKGYAEYAIILPKKNSSPDANVKNTKTDTNNLCSEKSLTRKKPSEEVTAISPKLHNKENNEKMFITKISMPTDNELLSYTAALVENILYKAKEELRVNKHLYDKMEKFDDLTNKILSTNSSVEKHLQCDSLQSLHCGEQKQTFHVKPKISQNTVKNNPEGVSLLLTNQKPQSDLSDDECADNINKNTAIDTFEKFKPNDLDKEINIRETKSSSYKSNVQLQPTEVHASTKYQTKNDTSKKNVPLETVSNKPRNMINADMCKPAMEIDVDVMQEQDNSTQKLTGHEGSLGKESDSFEDKLKIPNQLSEVENPLQNKTAVPNIYCEKYDSISQLDKSHVTNVVKNAVLGENEKQPAKFNSPHYSYMSHLINSDTFIHETEMELNKLHQLTSKSELQKQSIYKLAYDENTDQSEVDDQETTTDLTNGARETLNFPPIVPNSGSRTEILVHEDSASDAGSEDVELLPHRYESESAQQINKHIYVNNLSLAVELLRTRESLPYDDEFKRIVGDDVERSENRLPNTSSHKDAKNRSFVGVHRGDSQKESSLKNSRNEKNNHKVQSFYMKKTIINSNKWENGVEDQAEQSEDSGNDTEETKDEAHLNLRNKDNQFRAAQVRQQFHILSSRTGIVNPCLCCIIV